MVGYFGLLVLPMLVSGIGVLAGGAGDEVDLEDARVARVRAAILRQRTLHRAIQRVAVRRYRQAFHALVRHAARGIAADLVVAVRTEVRNRKHVRHGDDRGALAGLAIEAIDVRTSTRRR
jgi:hypothetical protein